MDVQGFQTLLAIAGPSQQHFAKGLQANIATCAWSLRERRGQAVLISNRRRSLVAICTVLFLSFIYLIFYAVLLPFIRTFRCFPMLRRDLTLGSVRDFSECSFLGKWTI